MPIVPHPGALCLPSAERMAEERETSVSEIVRSHTGEHAPGFYFQTHVTSGFLAFLCR